MTPSRFTRIERYLITMTTTIGIPYNDGVLTIRKVTFFTGSGLWAMSGDDIRSRVEGVARKVSGDSVRVEQHRHPRCYDTGASQLAWIDDQLKFVGDEDYLIVCSNSEHIFNGLRIAVMQGKLKASDVSVYFLTEDVGAEYVQIEADGKVKHWPPGFFDATEIALATLAKGQRELREKATKV